MSQQVSTGWQDAASSPSAPCNDLGLIDWNGLLLPFDLDNNDRPNMGIGGITRTQKLKMAA